ncbi:YecH family metal-binding protein [Shewanella woodyi]|uniref:YecH family metal-binding protein n=1 Tax=Shewanella woodyi TaxID=60961 RepID=UPI0007EB4606|nr:YecH family metal-binding protein [Shewanella woodyi]
MTQSIHGHQVMELMLALNKAISKEELKLLMLGQFGASAKYHTCSACEMSADELIILLERKGKFVISERGVETARDKICNH